MRTICLYFEIHQIIHLKRYRFFDIGTDHYYYDDYANETSINDVAERSYIPALNTLIEMVKNSGGAFKVAFSISGVALEQLEISSTDLSTTCTCSIFIGLPPERFTGIWIIKTQPTGVLSITFTVPS